MGKSLFCLLLPIGWFLTCSVHAQSIQSAFSMASDSALQGRWEGAKQILKPHLFPLSDDTLAPSMLLLYGMACEKTGDRISAFVSAEKLLNTFPDWSGKNDALFFSGELALKQNRFSKAFSHFSRLPKEPYLTDFENTLSKFYLPKDSLTALKSRSDLASDPFLKAAIDQKESAQTKPKINTPMKVGIVLPFHMDDLLKKKQNSSPASDFYRGMVLASEVLHAADSTIEIYAFDTKGESETLAKLLKDKALGGLDVVVGPLKVGELKMLSDWSKTTHTPCINPLSNHVPDEENDLFFTQQPSFATIALACFDFVSHYSMGKKVGIVFGPEKNDSLQAEAYRTLMKKMGRDVSLFKKVGKNSAANLTKFLLEADLDSTSHLFVPNNEALVRAQLLGAYGWMKAKYPIVVAGKWLEASNADFDEWGRNPIYFVSTDVPDFENTEWNNWANSFKTKWGTPPNWIAWKGFDLALTISRSWYREGKNWHVFWKSGQEINSALFGQYRYSKYQPDNQYVPIYQVENGMINRIWPTLDR